MTNRLRLGVLLAAVCWGSLDAQQTGPAGQWTRFRGPNGTGLSESVNLPVEFGPTQNVVWKTEVPPGHSSPVLTATRVFLTAHTKEKDSYKLYVIALDRKTGKLLWQREVPRRQPGRIQNVNGPASPSPVTDGTNVYALLQEFGMLAFDPDGRELWSLPMGPFSQYYGFGASPILVDDLIILPVDQDTKPHMVAIDRRTGKIRWRVERPGVISGYSTPTVYEPKNGPKQVVVPESFQLSSYSVADGRRVWWVRGLPCEMKSVASYDNEYLYINGWGFPQNQPGQQVATIPFEDGLKRYDKNADGLVGRDEITGTDPIDRMLSPKYGFDAFDLDRDGKLNAAEWEVFRLMMAAENGLLSIKLGGEGDMTSTAIRWRYQRPVPQVPSTLLYQGTLFMVNDSGILTSFEPATGKVLKQGRLKGAIDKYFASPIGADGKVWLISQDGTVSVVSAKAEWDVLAVNTLGDEVFATPAIADGRIYLRTRDTLYCFARSSAK
jgi:outer membrane protein assembly factor BamB